MNTYAARGGGGIFRKPMKLQNDYCHRMHIIKENVNYFLTFPGFFLLKILE